MISIPNGQEEWRALSAEQQLGLVTDLDEESAALKILNEFALGLFEIPTREASWARPS